MRPSAVLPGSAFGWTRGLLGLGEHAGSEMQHSAKDMGRTTHASHVATGQSGLQQVRHGARARTCEKMHAVEDTLRAWRCCAPPLVATGS